MALAGKGLHSMNVENTDDWTLKAIGSPLGVPVFTAESPEEISSDQSLHLLSVNGDDSLFVASDLRSLTVGSTTDLISSLKTSAKTLKDAKNVETAEPMVRVVWLANGHQFVALGESQTIYVFNSSLELEATIDDFKQHQITHLATLKESTAFVVSVKDEGVHILGSSKDKIVKGEDFYLSNDEVIVKLPQIDGEILHIESVTDSRLLLVVKDVAEDAEDAEDDYSAYYCDLNSNCELTEIEDACPPFGDLSRAFAWYSGVVKSYPEAGNFTVVAACSQSPDLLLATNSTKWELNDESDKLPLTAEDEDVIVVGATILKQENTSVSPLKSVDKAENSPFWLVLTQEGRIIAWNVVSKAAAQHNIGVLPTSLPSLPDFAAAPKEKATDSEEKSQELSESSNKSSNKNELESAQASSKDDGEPDKSNAAAQGETVTKEQSIEEQSNDQTKHKLEKSSEVASGGLPETSTTEKPTEQKTEVQRLPAAASPEPKPFGLESLRSPKGSTNPVSTPNNQLPQTLFGRPKTGQSFSTAFGQKSPGGNVSPFNSSLSAATSKFSFSGADSANANAERNKNSFQPAQNFGAGLANVESNEDEPKSSTASAEDDSFENDYDSDGYDSDEESPIISSENESASAESDLNPEDQTADAAIEEEARLAEERRRIEQEIEAKKIEGERREREAAIEAANKIKEAEQEKLKEQRRLEEQQKIEAEARSKKESVTRLINSTDFALDHYKSGFVNARSLIDEIMHNVGDLSGIDAILADTNLLFQVLDHNLHSLENDGIFSNKATDSLTKSDLVSRQLATLQHEVDLDTATRVNTADHLAKVSEEIRNMKVDVIDCNSDLFTLNESNTDIAYQLRPLPFRTAAKKAQLNLKMGEINKKISDIQEKMALALIEHQPSHLDAANVFLAVDTIDQRLDQLTRRVNRLSLKLSSDASLPDILDTLSLEQVNFRDRQSKRHDLSRQTDALLRSLAERSPEDILTDVDF